MPIDHCPGITRIDVLFCDILARRDEVIWFAGVTVALLRLYSLYSFYRLLRAFISKFL